MNKFQLLQIAHEKQALAFSHYARAEKNTPLQDTYMKYGDKAAKTAENFYNLARKAN